MTNYEIGDLILVPFPFSDLSTSKKRPAVVVSSGEYNKFYSDVIILAVTSKIERKKEWLEIRIEDWVKAGLLSASAIKPVITTIDKKLILKKFGVLTQKDQSKLKPLLKQIFTI